jgi:hypothetical protein
MEKVGQGGNEWRGWGRRNKWGGGVGQERMNLGVGAGKNE